MFGEDKARYRFKLEITFHAVKRVSAFRLLPSLRVVIHVFSCLDSNMQTRRSVCAHACFFPAYRTSGKQKKKKNENSFIKISFKSLIYREQVYNRSSIELSKPRIDWSKIVINDSFFLYLKLKFFGDWPFGGT